MTAIRAVCSRCRHAFFARMPFKGTILGTIRLNTSCPNCGAPVVAERAAAPSPQVAQEAHSHG